MSERHTPRTHRHEDSLFDYGDRLAAGQAPPPRDELEATAERVHRALRAPQPSDQGMSADQKAAIWEEIMRSPTIRPFQAPVAPGNGAERHRAPRPAVTSRGPAGRPQPRPMWTRAANIALVVLVILAGIGVVRGYGGFDGLTGSDGPATMPGTAMHASTPAATVTEPAAASVGTPAPLTTCALSGDIPIITDLAEDKAPVSGTSLYLVHYDRTSAVPRGDLKLGCEGKESVVLAENVYSVGQGPWPGTASVWILPPGTDDLAAVRRAYVSLATGAMITFGAETNRRLVSQGPVTGSPWVIGPSADAPATLVIADLRTMVVRPLSEVAGIPVPADATVLMSQPADDGTIAVGFARSYSGDAAGDTLMTNTGAPGNLLLLGTSFDDTRWITLPDSLLRISAVTLSPDGSHAAVVSMGEGDVVAGSYRYGVIDTAGGTLIGASADIAFEVNPFVAWIRNGGAVAYLDGSKLQTLSIDGNGQPETVFEAGVQLNGLQTTWDPNVVVASTTIDRGSDASADQAAKDASFAVNVETGAVHEFAGIDASRAVSWITDAGALVMFDWDDAHPDTVTYRVFDPVTGAQIGTIADAPTVQAAPRTSPTLGPRSIAVSADGRVEVVALGTQQIYVFTAGPNGLTMRRVPSPDGLLSEMFLTANVTLSPDGTLLSLNGEEDEDRVRYLISLDDPNATWLAIPNNVVGERGRGLITFVDGA